MSKLNIKRAVENIRANTTVYTPVVEMIVNAIQAIDESGRTDGRVSIRAQRSSQPELDGSLPEVSSFEVEDNGIGFTDVHRNSFDTLYTDLRINEGGKGFGRFTGLKYFEDLHVKSVYRDGSDFKARSFSMGKDNDIIVREKVAVSEKQEPGTVVTLSVLKKRRSFDKKLPTIARSLVERLLPYFITQDYMCPAIVLSEQDGSGAIRLNDFVSNELSAVIREIGVERKTFTLKASDTEEEFQVRVFKLYAPRNPKSRISLVAHKREVTRSAIQKYIPEFEDEFYEKDSRGEIDHARNFIIKAYVFGSYLDRNVSLERGGFEFHMESDLILGIAQAEIERDAASIAKKAMGADITLRQEKKKERVQSYVDEEAPWHKAILDKIDLNGMPYNPTNEEIEIKRDVVKLLAESNFENVRKSVL